MLSALVSSVSRRAVALSRAPAPFVVAPAFRFFSTESTENARPSKLSPLRLSIINSREPENLLQILSSQSSSMNMVDEAVWLLSMSKLSRSRRQRDAVHDVLRSNPLAKALVMNIETRFDNYDVRALIDIFLAFARLNIGRPAIRAKLLEKVKSNFDKVFPNDYVKVLEAVSRARVEDQEFVSAVLAKCEYNLVNYNIGTCISFARAAAAIKNTNEEVARKLVAKIAPEVSSFTRGSFMDVLIAVSKMGSPSVFDDASREAFAVHVSSIINDPNRPSNLDRFARAAQSLGFDIGAYQFSESLPESQ
eukprot:GILI01003438.1.p2 GENE.GILI01003438.1~~GILI01003438.1.p2  ORF type:complete len:327 (+),score=111.70 GILI01003438.1:66-983(+)